MSRINTGASAPAPTKRSFPRGLVKPRLGGLATPKKNTPPKNVPGTGEAEAADTAHAEPAQALSPRPAAVSAPPAHAHSPATALGSVVAATAATAEAEADTVVSTRGAAASQAPALNQPPSEQASEATVNQTPRVAAAGAPVEGTGTLPPMDLPAVRPAPGGDSAKRAHPRGRVAPKIFGSKVASLAAKPTPVAVPGTANASAAVTGEQAGQRMGAAAGSAGDADKMSAEETSSKAADTAPRGEAAARQARGPDHGGDTARVDVGRQAGTSSQDSAEQHGQGEGRGAGGPAGAAQRKVNQGARGPDASASASTTPSSVRAPTLAATLEATLAAATASVVGAGSQGVDRAPTAARAPLAGSALQAAASAGAGEDGTRAVRKRKTAPGTQGDREAPKTAKQRGHAEDAGLGGGVARGAGGGVRPSLFLPDRLLESESGQDPEGGGDAGAMRGRRAGKDVHVRAAPPCAVCIHTYVCINTCIHLQTDTHTHTHTQTQTVVQARNSMQGLCMFDQYV